MTNPIRDLIEKVREINRKYAKPRIKMSRPVRIALLGLRFYLIFLLILLLYKFILAVR